MHVDRGQQNVLRTVKSPFQPAHICRLAKVYMNIEMISVIRKRSRSVIESEVSDQHVTLPHPTLRYTHTHTIPAPVCRGSF